MTQDNRLRTILPPEIHFSLNLRCARQIILDFKTVLFYYAKLNKVSACIWCLKLEPRVFHFSSGFFFSLGPLKDIYLNVTTIQ